jgi:hypothetical protein
MSELTSNARNSPWALRSSWTRMFLTANVGDERWARARAVCACGRPLDLGGNTSAKHLAVPLCTARFKPALVRRVREDGQLTHVAAVALV